jgi:hypothetical protein
VDEAARFAALPRDRATHPLFEDETCHAMPCHGAPGIIVFYRRSKRPPTMCTRRLQIDVFRPLPRSDAEPLAAADAAVAAWEQIETLLSPVLGSRGVAALYKRSLHLTLAGRPWLAPAYEGPLAPGDFAALHATLAAQDGAAAAAGSAELMANFRELLASLIGETLTDKLLAPQQRARPDSDATKEPSP